jgi:hypothetical protein
MLDWFTTFMEQTQHAMWLNWIMIGRPIHVNRISIGRPTSTFDGKRPEGGVGDVRPAGAPNRHHQSSIPIG